MSKQVDQYVQRTQVFQFLSLVFTDSGRRALTCVKRPMYNVSQTGTPTSQCPIHIMCHRLCVMATHEDVFQQAHCVFACWCLSPFLLLIVAPLALA